MHIRKVRYYCSAHSGTTYFADAGRLRAHFVEPFAATSSSTTSGGDAGGGGPSSALPFDSRRLLACAGELDNGSSFPCIFRHFGVMYLATYGSIRSLTGRRHSLSKSPRPSLLQSVNNRRKGDRHKRKDA